ncbi:hypothetical protein P3T27_002093 [Kitasatospora sp. MAA19]|nr:hypothetical protein [Kitasatospora sp. MAA19]
MSPTRDQDHSEQGASAQTQSEDMSSARTATVAAKALSKRLLRGIEEGAG